MNLLFKRCFLKRIELQGTLRRCQYLLSMKLNPLMPGGNKKVHILQQTYSWKHHQALKCYHQTLKGYYRALKGYHQALKGYQQALKG